MARSGVAGGAIGRGGAGRAAAAWLRVVVSGESCGGRRMYRDGAWRGGSAPGIDGFKVVKLRNRVARLDPRPAKGWPEVPHRCNALSRRRPQKQRGGGE